MPTTFVIPGVIERINRGVCGYRDRPYSYVDAHCETGHLQATGEFSFSDGIVLYGTFAERCTAKG